MSESTRAEVFGRSPNRQSGRMLGRLLSGLRHSCGPSSWLLMLLVMGGILSTRVWADEPTAQDTAAGLQAGLLADWPLGKDGRDVSGQGRHLRSQGDLQWGQPGPAGPSSGAVSLNGRTTYLELPADQIPDLGTGDFSVSMWMQHATQATCLPGDLLSHYDPATLRGIQLGLKSQAVTTSVANDRHLHFGIDDQRESGWQDCGRPGNALLAFGLVVHRGELYAGTCEPGAGESGRVYRYAGGDRWIDCGAPDNSNSVTSLAVYEGELYVGTGKYRVAGSSLPESENQELGGRVFRYGSVGEWIPCGRLPDTEAIGGMVVYRGRLYASSLYRPAGFYRYEGDDRWTDCGVPEDGRRVVALGVFEDGLFGSSYDGGRVYRFDGEHWQDLGQLEDNTQTYSFAVYQGQLHVGTWPSGRVYRYESPGVWTDIGRLGEELEVMGMLIHNGRFLAGTLPLAEVYAYTGGTNWRRLDQLDRTPDVKYRRAWSMAEHQGRAYVSTLPSGHIHAYAAGLNTLHGHTIPAGWNHVGAVRRGGEIELYLNGNKVASAKLPPGEKPYNLTHGAPLWIGRGQNGPFQGELAQVKLYSRALSPAECQQLAKSSTNP